jgi:hypothetical protein
MQGQARAFLFFAATLSHKGKDLAVAVGAELTALSPSKEKGTPDWDAVWVVPNDISQLLESLNLPGFDAKAARRGADAASARYCISTNHVGWQELKDAKRTTDWKVKQGTRHFVLLTTSAIIQHLQHLQAQHKAVCNKDLLQESIEVIKAIADASRQKAPIISLTRPPQANNINSARGNRKAPQPITWPRLLGLDNLDDQGKAEWALDRLAPLSRQHGLKQWRDSAERDAAGNDKHMQDRFIQQLKDLNDQLDGQQRANPPLPAPHFVTQKAYPLFCVPHQEVDVTVMYYLASMVTDQVTGAQQLEWDKYVMFTFGKDHMVQAVILAMHLSAHFPPSCPNQDHEHVTSYIWGVLGPRRRRNWLRCARRHVTFFEQPLVVPTAKLPPLTQELDQHHHEDDIDNHANRSMVGSLHHATVVIVWGVCFLCSGQCWPPCAHMGINGAGQEAGCAYTTQSSSPCCCNPC